jgi:hypothetical protein
MVEFDIASVFFLILYHLAKKGTCLVGKWHLGLNRHVWGDNEYGPLGKFEFNLKFMKFIYLRNLLAIICCLCCQVKGLTTSSACRTPLWTDSNWSTRHFGLCAILCPKVSLADIFSALQLPVWTSPLCTQAFLNYYNRV